MDILKRALAPIVPEAWREIDEEAKRVLTLNLAGRKLVDFDGPHGWQHAAVNIGRLSLHKKQPDPGVHVGTRELQPLIEVRVPFQLDTMELDCVARGAKGLDLDSVVSAAERIARTEDNAIFNGYKEAGITGLIEASPHKPLPIPSAAIKYPQLIVEAREVLRESGINGPYALALGSQCYKEVAQATEDGYPIRKRIEQQIIDGPLVWAPAVRGAVLLSARGGDFVLTVGQDLSIGYASHDRDKVELYLTESFTFRVLDGAAAVYLKHPGK
jgi:uncharacterized linocin/CFP29 family protein